MTQSEKETTMITLITLYLAGAFIFAIAMGVGAAKNAEDKGIPDTEFVVDLVEDAGFFVKGVFLWPTIVAFKITRSAIRKS
jgi:hypothetical protein